MILTPTTEPVLGGLRKVAVDGQSWQELSTCPVCGRADHLSDLAIVAGGSTGAVITACLDCEHVFKRRRPSAEWLDEYYSHDWDAAGQSKLEERVQVHPRRKILDFCAEHLTAPAKVLDMGAGFGKDLLAFRDAGHAVHAVETSEHRADYLSEVLGIPCVTAPFEVADLPDDLDLIFSHHVLEHVVDPAAVVARAGAVLPQGGLLYIAVPNCLSFEHALQFLHYAPHQSGFSLKSLTRLLAAHGFEVVKAVATREVKLLARRSRSESAPVDGSRGVDPDFREAVERWVVEGFGRRAGNRTHLWWRGGGKGINRCYEGALVPGGQRVYRSIQGVRRAYSRAPAPPRRLRRLLPVFVYKPEVRMIHVHASGDLELPVTVHYADSSPPIWVK